MTIDNKILTRMLSDADHFADIDAVGTGCFAAIYNNKGLLMASGANYINLKNGARYKDVANLPREQRLAFIVHAEANALNQLEPTVEAPLTLYVVPMCPCVDCAKKIVDDGRITHVISGMPTQGQRERWGKSMEQARELLMQAGISFSVVKL